MLIFIIPLKSKKRSQSWENTCFLLERCLKSVCNQTSSSFRVIVVCNEKPLLNFHHSSIDFVEVDFSWPNESSDYLAREADKGRKLLAGLVYAKKKSPSHVMFVDADDCINKKIAELVESNSHENGWFIDQGYRYEDGSSYIHYFRRKFYLTCGTCNIIKYDLINVPDDPEYNRGFGYYQFYIEHSSMKKTLEKEGKSIKPLPFPGAVYIVKNGENHSLYSDSPFKNRYSSFRKNFLGISHYKAIVASIFERRKLSQEICDNFSLLKPANLR